MVETLKYFLVLLAVVGWVDGTCRYLTKVQDDEEYGERVRKPLTSNSGVSAVRRTSTRVWRGNSQLVL